MCGREGQLELDLRELNESMSVRSVIVGVFNPGNDSDIQLFSSSPDAMLLEGVVLRQRVERLHCGATGQRVDSSH